MNPHPLSSYYCVWLSYFLASVGMTLVSIAAAAAVIDWVLQELILSTSILRSSLSFQYLQTILLFCCLIAVPWTFFSSALLMKIREMRQYMKEAADSKPESGSELPAAQDDSVGMPSGSGGASDTLLQEEDAAPLHFNTLRSPARLRGLLVPQRPMSRSSSMSRSRSSSPVPNSYPEASNTSISRVSSTRSLDGEEKVVLISATSDKHGHHHLITEDMLTDRLGFEDLTSGSSSPVGNASYSMPVSLITLTSVNERMSEETLDDCHAFNDIKRGKRSSSTVGEGDILGTLPEDLEDEDEDGEGNPGIKEESERPDSEKEESGMSITKKAQNSETQTTIMFEMLNLISTPDERRKLEEEKRKKLVGGDKNFTVQAKR